MTDIPEDIFRKAGELIVTSGLASAVGAQFHLSIAQALVDERKRCALIAENCGSFPFEGDHIGKLIRSTP